MASNNKRKKKGTKKTLKKNNNAQLLICITLIIASIVMLGIHDNNRDFWMVTLSSLVGYIMPTPNYPKVIKNKVAG